MKQVRQMIQLNEDYALSADSMRDTLTLYFDQLDWKELCPQIELLGEEC